MSCYMLKINSQACYDVRQCDATVQAYSTNLQNQISNMPEAASVAIWQHKPRTENAEPKKNPRNAPVANKGYQLHTDLLIRVEEDIDVNAFWNRICTTCNVRIQPLLKCPPRTKRDMCADNGML